MEHIPGDYLTLWCVLVVYNENPTRALNTTSLKCCLPSSDAIDRWEKIHTCVKVQGHLMQVRFIEIQQVFPKTIRSDTFLTVLVFTYFRCYGFDYLWLVFRICLNSLKACSLFCIVCLGLLRLINLMDVILFCVISITAVQFNLSTFGDIGIFDFKFPKVLIYVF